MTALTPVADVPYPVGTDPLGMVDTYVKAVADWIEDWQKNRCRVYPGATVNTVNNGVLTTISFGAETYDSNGLHDNAVNPSRVNIVKSGRYRVTAQAMWQSNAAGWRFLVLANQAGTVFANVTQMAVNGTDTRHQVTGTVLLSAGNYVQLQASQNSGANLTLDSGTGNTWLEVEWIGVE